MNKEILDDLKERESSARIFSNIFSWTGIIAVPSLAVGILTGNKILAISSLCWFVSHFIGYLTRMIHEEHKTLAAKLQCAEFSVNAEKETATFRHKMTLN